MSLYVTILSKNRIGKRASTCITVASKVRDEMRTLLFWVQDVNWDLKALSAQPPVRHLLRSVDKGKAVGGNALNFQKAVWCIPHTKGIKETWPPLGLEGRFSYRWKPLVMGSRDKMANSQQEKRLITGWAKDPNGDPCSVKVLMSCTKKGAAKQWNLLMTHNYLGCSRGGGNQQS